MKKIFYLLLSVATLFVSCEDYEAINPHAKKGLLPGKFSISETKQVQFSQGNLQARPCDSTWRFAPHQYDTIGSNGDCYEAWNFDRHYTGWIDLFDWKYSRPYEIEDNERILKDWGFYAISNGGKQAGLWRTLYLEEWNYLFFERANAADLFGFGTVNGVGGIILLPDDWCTPKGLTFHASMEDLEEENSHYVNRNGNNYSHNTYDYKQWKEMEKSGAVFLPDAGGVYGNECLLDNSGNYWTLSESDSGVAYVIRFNKGYFYPTNRKPWSWGGSVRLVRPCR